MATIKDRAVLQTIFHPNVPFDEDFQEEQGKQQAVQGDDSLPAGGGRFFFHKLQRLLSLQALGSKEMPPISGLTTDSLTCFSQIIFKSAT